MIDSPVIRPTSLQQLLHSHPLSCFTHGFVCAGLRTVCCDTLHLVRVTPHVAPLLCVYVIVGVMSLFGLLYLVEEFYQMDEYK